MPFDAGAVTPLNFSGNGPKLHELNPTPLQPPQPQTAGAVLRAAREAQGRTLPQVAEQTRVRRAYLQAIEDMRADQLPSRPFAVGYAKAYARALGLDAEDLAERFKRELPGADGPALKPPVGVAHDEQPNRWPLVIGGTAAVLGVVLLWNVAQRAVGSGEAAPPPAPPAPSAWLRTPAPSGPVRLAPPAPAPSEQTIPEPYATPGLEAFAAQQAGTGAGPGQVTGVTALMQPGVTLPPAEITAAQGSRTAHFGQGAFNQTVYLKARRSASLVIRTPDGERILFARLMQAGDSWRHPVVPGMVVEVSEPSAWDVYAYGQFKGQMAGLASTLPQLAS